jgi:transcriptional regulator with XRE-family HTH domain
MEQTLKEIGKSIRAIRLYKLYDQREFARRLKISRTYLSLVECGQRAPSIPLLYRIAEFSDQELVIQFKFRCM